MKDLKYYIEKAYSEKWAIGQFNFSAFEQVKGIVQAAQNLKSPIILGTSEGESKFVGLQEAVAIRDVLRKKTGLPIFLNLDHGKSVDLLKEAILAGYDMVHFDGSKLPLDENIKTSIEVRKMAKRIVMEGEVGRFGTDASKVYTEKFEIKEENLTQVEEAQKYMSAVKVNLLAVSIGTFHGIDVTGVSPKLRLEKLKEIKGALNMPMVLHGGSGTSADQIKDAIALGISKVNINTETRMAFSNTMRKTLENNKDEITPYKYFPEAIEAVRQVIEIKIGEFGSADKI